ncbi:MAG TPA: AMP-binding protein, partial [Ferruginibacter sp.]|nr:AMP-binding protein [Ferruginibacter sp.]
MIQPTRLFDFLQYQLEKFPKNDMLTGKVNGRWEPLSTEVVMTMVNNLSNGLKQLGISGNDMTVERQDKIALISKNRPEWLILDLACQQIGAILTPIYPTTNINELEFIFNDAAVKYVFVSGDDILEKVNNIRDRVPSIIDVYSFDEMEGAKHWVEILAAAGNASLDNMRNSIMPHHCATIIYTSGTTGTPKGVMLSHHNIVSNVVNAKKSFPFDDDRNAKALSFLPLNHIFERMISYVYMCSGISIYYAESLEALGENLKEVRPHVFCTVPRLLEKVYERIMSKGAELKGTKRKLFYWAVNLAEQYDNLKSRGIWYDVQLAIANKLIFNKWREALGNNVQYIVTGSAACQVKLLRIFTAAKIPVYEGYGPTENSPAISVNCRTKGGTKFGTVGLVLQGQEVKLQPDGEICVKGPSVMMGYYKKPEL